MTRALFICYNRIMKNKLLCVMMCVFLSLPVAACKDVSSGTNMPDKIPDDIVTPVIPDEPQTPDISTEPENPDEPDLPQNPPAANLPSVPEEPNVPTVTPPAPQPEIPDLDKLVVSTVNGLNIRSGAGTGYKSIGTLDKSDMAMPVKKSGSWYEIRYKNTVGYVSEKYVEHRSFSLGSDTVERVIDEGKKLLGLPYVFGAQRYHWGNGVKNTNYDGLSYDCSSLMQYIFKIGANVNLAMTSREQSVQGTAVSKQYIRRGDLLFFTNASRVNKTGIERIGHVALYLGDNIILHTASDHAVIEPISSTRWGYYINARRVV